MIEGLHYQYSTTSLNPSIQPLYLDYNEYIGDVHPETLTASILSESDLKLYFRPDNNIPDDFLRKTLKVDTKINLFLTPGADHALEEILRYCRQNLKITTYHNLHNSTYDHFNIFCRKCEFTETTFANSELIYICSPNNPDGLLTSPDEIANLVENNPTKLFILDFSYLLYSPYSFQDFTEKIKSFPNFVFVSSFAKIFPLGGVRMGVLGSPDEGLSNYLNKFLNLKMITPSARRIFNSCLKNYDFYLNQVKEIYNNRFVLQKMIQEFLIENHIEHNTDDLANLGGNFICVYMNAVSQKTAVRLFAENNILVRQKSHWNFIRITSANNRGISTIQQRLLNDRV